MFIYNLKMNFKYVMFIFSNLKLNTFTNMKYLPYDCINPETQSCNLEQSFSTSNKHIFTKILFLSKILLN